MLRSKHVLKALNALAQESRLSVFKLLVKQGKEGMASGEIARKLEIPPATLSFHLSHLNNAKLVTSRKEGRSIIYSANFDRMQGVLEYLLDRCCDVKIQDACGAQLTSCKTTNESADVAEDENVA